TFPLPALSPPPIYPLSLHDALPISLIAPSPGAAGGAAAGVARRLGLPEPRQHARGAADGRPRSAAGHAAPHPAGLARARRAGSRPARLLRVLLGAHGALGRSGRRRADG